MHHDGNILNYICLILNSCINVFPTFARPNWAPHLLLPYKVTQKAQKKPLEKKVNPKDTALFFICKDLYKDSDTICAYYFVVKLGFPSNGPTC